MQPVVTMAWGGGKFSCCTIFVSCILSNSFSGQETISTLILLLDLSSVDLFCLLFFSRVNFHFPLCSNRASGVVAFWAQLHCVRLVKRSLLWIFRFGFHFNLPATLSEIDNHVDNLRGWIWATWKQRSGPKKRFENLRRIWKGISVVTQKVKQAHKLSRCDSQNYVSIAHWLTWG